MSPRAKPDAPARGDVVTIRPALLRDRDAAAYLGRSPSWIRAKRAEDIRAKREGRQESGPPWKVLEKSVFYLLSDLDAWIASRAVDRGVVAFSNRGAADRP